MIEDQINWQKFGILSKMNADLVSKYVFYIYSNSSDTLKSSEVNPENSRGR